MIVTTYFQHQGTFFLPLYKLGFKKPVYQVYEETAPDAATAPIFSFEHPRILADQPVSKLDYPKVTIKDMLIIGIYS